MSNQTEAVRGIARTLNEQYDKLLAENEQLRAERDFLLTNGNMAFQTAREQSVRPEVQWFAKQMEAKLRANDHKQHWSKLQRIYLIERLFQEANELWLAIRNGEPVDNIVQEAADVANFAMMIADNAGQRP